jgi:hypothetical protein
VTRTNRLPCSAPPQYRRNTDVIQTGAGRQSTDFPHHFLVRGPSCQPLTFPARMIAAMARSARAAAMAVLLAAYGAPMAANPLPDSARQAALTACAPGPATLSDRATKLANAGWVVAADTLVRRELFALARMTRFSQAVGEGGPEALAQFIDIRDSMSMGQAAEAGVAPTLALLTPSDGAAMPSFDLEVPGTVAALNITVIAQAERPDLALRCAILLSEPQPFSVIRALIPPGTDPSIIDERPEPAGSLALVIRLRPPDGNLSQLQQLDLSQRPAFAALPAQTGSDTTLNTMITLDISPVPLE